MTEENGATTRRAVLKLAATGAPAAAVAAAFGGTPVAAEPDPSRETMQDTLHTRAYYDSARF